MDSLIFDVKQHFKNVFKITRLQIQNSKEKSEKITLCTIYV